jgi:hypothetical protein
MHMVFPSLFGMDKVVYGMHVNTTWGGNNNPFVNDETISDALPSSL